MRGPFLTLALTCTLAIAQQGDATVLRTQVETLRSATTDAARDSVNALVERSLRASLEGPDPFGAWADEVPITRVDAPDGRFRLFTWNLPREDGGHAYKGFLLVREKRGQLLYELRDMTDHLPSPEVPELGPENWYGALYYEAIATVHGGRTYYTLLGWKGYSRVETRKVIEVLSFRGATPRFGAPLFGEGRLKRNRRVFGYSFQTSMSMKQVPDGRIVFDHLAPMTPSLDGQAAFMGPDLSYDAYRWEKGRWVYQRDVDARDLDMTKPWKAPPREAPTR